MFGLINLYKPEGPTSRDCVNKVQRLIKPIKVGHAGTLDPIASGVLILLVGNATRLTEEIHAANKEYVGTFQLGVSSPSADIETEATPIESAPRITEQDLKSVLPKFTGNIEQIPPIYSAIRIDGKRAHEIAREGEQIEMPARQVTIEELEILECNYPYFKFRAVCSTGTYIRSLGRDIARALGSDAIMTNLVRTRIGQLTLANSIAPSTLDSPKQIEDCLLSPRLGLSHFPQLVIPPEILIKFNNGQKVAADAINTLKQAANLTSEGDIIAIDSNEQLRAVITFERNGNYWRTAKYFHY